MPPTIYRAVSWPRLWRAVLGQSVVVSNVTGSNGATCTQRHKDGRHRRLHLPSLTNTAALNGNEATGMVDFRLRRLRAVAV
ncbi:MAG: hypothetical protein ACLU38_07285 [Dysosmobacter sp.]